MAARDVLVIGGYIAFPSPISGEGGRRSLTDGGWPGPPQALSVAARTRPPSERLRRPPSPERGKGMLYIRRSPAHPAPPTCCFRLPSQIYSVTSHHGWSPCQTPAHPVGGEGVGSSASMSAGCGRAMKPGGWRLRGSLRASMDDVRLLAARFLSGPMTVKAVMSAARCRPQGRRR